MNELPLLDRRLASNHPLSELVNTALNCRETFGEGAAKRVFLSYNIPSTISARVLFHAMKRRLTESERVRAAAEANDSCAGK